MNTKRLFRVCGPVALVAVLYPLPVSAKAEPGFVRDTAEGARVQVAVVELDAGDVDVIEPYDESATDEPHEDAAADETLDETTDEGATSICVALDDDGAELLVPCP